MSQQNKKRIVIVLGMHRSGTSAITRGLKVLGVELGERFAVASAEDNEKGFWEDLDINDLDRELLHHLGHDWHTLSPIRPEEFERADIGPFGARAIALLRAKLEGVAAFGVKDPRLTRLLPFWKTVFAELDVDVGYVIAIRHPASVARSLQKRNGFDPEKSYYLWLGHVVPQMLDSAGSAAVVVDYDRMMAQPEVQLRRIAKALCLPFDPASPEVIEYAREFLQADLRHTYFRIEDFRANDEVPAEVVEAYGVLDRLADDVEPPNSPAVQACFARLANRLHDLAPALNAIGRREADLEQLVQANRTLQYRVDAGERELEQHTRQIAELQTTVAALERRLADAAAAAEAAAAKAATAAATEALLVERTELSEQRQRDLIRMSDWAVGLRAQLDWRNAELARQAELLTRLDRHPLRHFAKKSLRGSARIVYRSLPLPPETKQQLRGWALRSIRGLLPWDGGVQATMPAVVADRSIAVAPDGKPLPPLRPAVAPPITGQTDVLVFSIIDWHFRIQRPQHLAREFAKAGQRAFFFSNQFHDAAEPGFSVETLEPGLPLYQIKLHVKGAPAIYFSPPSAAALTQMTAGMAMFLDWCGARMVDCLVQHAFWFHLARRLPNARLVYDCMDHHEGFGNVSQEMLDLETATMQKADLLVATSSWLEQHTRRENGNVAVIRNAGEYDFFCQPPVDVFRDEEGRRVIGYYGAIAEWFDLELVEQIALACPDALVLLVGNDTTDAGKRLKRYANVRLTGEVPYAKLPYYLYGFDVCMMPFRVIPLTLATNPVKVYEYLSAAKPVVAVKLPEMVQFDGLVHAADSQQAFVDAVRAVLSSLPESEDTLAARRCFAAGQTWAHRVAALRERIDAVPAPRISVVVLTYNNLDLTRACLESLERQSDYPNLEIVVVDNASQDESPQFLLGWSAGKANVKLILNNENLGFAAGNNIGLAAATGDYLVVLNNDTVVSAGWAKGLMRHLRDNPDIGIIGPVTNNIGNEAKVRTSYTTLEAMPAEAARLTQAKMGQWFEINTVAFFCVMMPRATYEAVGGLCEEYGLGFFEDDDYCRRVQARGLRVACAEDVFVHHHLSASFNKLGDERKQALFVRNKAIYESKWGPWEPHRYRTQ